MNKKTKRITVGLVAVLCFLLVFALGFGLTGAYYAANRRASGTVQMDQGIKLAFTGLETLQNGDLTSKLEGKILEDLETDKPLNKSIAPAATVKLVNPTITGATGTTDFYVKVKLTYRYRLYEAGSTTEIDDAPTALYTADDLGLDEDALYATQVVIANTFGEVAADSDWKVYGTKAAPTRVNASTAAIPILNGTDLVFEDWTAAGNVERGGPVVTYNEASREVAQVVLTLDIMTIQADNLDPTDLEAWLTAEIA